MQLICPHCQARYQLNREIPANAIFQCKKCQHKFKAVAQAEAPLAAAPVARGLAVARPIAEPVQAPHVAVPIAMPPPLDPAEPPVVQQVYEATAEAIAPPIVDEAQVDATAPAHDDIFGINIHVAPAAKPARAVTAATVNASAPKAAANAAPAPLTYAERRALQKKKSTQLLLASSGILLLLALGGLAYYFLRDPKTPVAKSNDEPAKTAAKPEKTEPANKAPEKAAPVTPAEKPEPMAVVTPAAPAPAPAKIQEIKVRPITYKLAEPIIRWHLAATGQSAAAATDKGQVDGYSLAKPAHLWSYEDELGVATTWKISALAFSSVASTATQQPLLLVSGKLLSEQHFLVSLDASDGKEIGQYKALKSPANFLLFHPAKPNLLLAALADEKGSLQLLNLNVDRVVAELLHAHESPVRGLAISLDGERCVTTSSKPIEGKDKPGSVLTTWSLTDVGREKEYTDFTGTASALSLSPDGKLLAVHESGETTGTIQILKFPDLELVTKIPGVAATVPEGLQLHAFVPGDETLLAAVGQDLVYFQLPAGEKRAIIPKVFAEQPQALLVSPDGKSILTSSGGKDFKLWKLP